MSICYQWAENKNSPLKLLLIFKRKARRKLRLILKTKTGAGKILFQSD